MGSKRTKSNGSPPSKRPVLFMVAFSAIHASIFSALKIQCKQNSSNMLSERSPLSKLNRWHKVARLHYLFLISQYTITLIKYTIITLLSLDSLKDSRLLDCFLVGRVSFIGRTNKISRQIGQLAAAMFMFYRVRLTTFASGYRFYGLEFLLYDYDNIVMNEAKAGKRKIELRRSAREKIQHEYVNQIISQQNYNQSVPISAILHFKNPFSSPDHDEYILRPNRTSKSWTNLAQYTIVSLVLSILATLFWIILMSNVLGASILTNTGFELNYPNCLSWVREQQQQERKYLSNSTKNPPEHLKYSSIYVPKDRLAFEMDIDDLPFTLPFEDFPMLTPYNIFRICFDIYENSFWYIDFFFIYVSIAYTSLLMSIDLMINAREIKLHLENIIDRLHEKLLKAKIVYFDLTPAHVRLTYHNQQPIQLKNFDQLDTDISQLQAILLDHFTMVKGYNCYMAFYIIFCTIIWFQYSIIICSWMGIIRSTAVEKEFALAETITFFILLSLLAGAALVRNLNRQLYPLIASAMALDCNCIATKSRWLIIMQYYYPKSLFCFRIFSSIELSWFFCLKVSVNL